MPAEARHHPRGDLRAATLLAASAGFLDAFVFLRVTSTFVANMSGNLVRVGIGLGEGHWEATVAATLALMSFAGAVAVATTALDWQLRAGRSRVEAFPLLVIESGLIVLVMVLLLANGVDEPAGLGARTAPALVVAALAMGVQATSLRAVGEVAISTTYGTGAVVRLSEKVALGMRGAVRPLELSRRDSVRIMLAVLVSYVGGAAIGALVGDAPVVLLVPAGAVLVAAASVRDRADQPDDAAPGPSHLAA
jgi:uncharacterized membrane protein YoaK (UPF0700 family)